jgi:hypothetical protein
VLRLCVKFAVENGIRRRVPAPGIEVPPFTVEMQWAEHKLLGTEPVCPEHLVLLALQNMGKLFEQIKRAVREDRFLVGWHADERCEERGASTGNSLVA